MARPKKQNREKIYGTRAIIYLRVSGDTQVREGYGLEAQQDACQDYTERKGYTVVATLRDEAISGAKDFSQRPALTQAMGMCVTGQADVFLCYALDRQSRDVVLFNTVRSQLKKAGVRFETAKEGQDFTTDDSMLMGDIYAAFAAEERRRISARLYGGRRQRSKRDGQGSGPLPWGYVKSMQGIQIDEQAALVIRLLFRLRKRNTYQQTADALNKRGYKPPKGEKWTVGQIFNIEQNKELYRTGKRRWDGVESSEQWPIILEK